MPSPVVCNLRELFSTFGSASLRSDIEVMRGRKYHGATVGSRILGSANGNLMVARTSKRVAQPLSAADCSTMAIMRAVLRQRRDVA